MWRISDTWRILDFLLYKLETLQNLFLFLISCHYCVTLNVLALKKTGICNALSNYSVPDSTIF